MFVSSEATCTVYQATTNRYNLNADDISDDFRAGLNLMPYNYTDSTKRQYFEFIDAFGTHVMIGLGLGGYGWG